MYSKELEELIDSVLADGVITDQERTVLRKRALACGEDPDEVMIVVDGRLAKMKKGASPAIPATEKRGNIVKCPNCGAPIEAGAVKCKECGYVFTNVKANNTAKEFAIMLEQRIQKVRYDGDKTNINKVNEFIKNYPLPTGKEDLLEFIASLDARRRSKSNYQEAYNAKYQECVTKAKTLFAGDSDVTSLLAQTEKGYRAHTFIASVIQHKKIIFIAIVVVLLLKGCIYALDADTTGWDKVSDAIKEQNTTEVINLIGEIDEYYLAGHKGEIQIYMQRLITEGKIKEANELGDAVKLAAPKTYITKPLHDYYLNQGDATNAEKYDAPLDDTDGDASSNGDAPSGDGDLSE
nr:zinc ribbon domain-containing protein [Prevotella sp.]